MRGLRALLCVVFFLGAAAQACAEDVVESPTSGTGGCWVDEKTGLCWQIEAPAETYTFATANTYCEGLTEGGRSDWRLPTVDELITLIPDSCSSSECTKVQDPECLDSSCEDDCNWNGCAEGAGPANGCYWNAALSGTCDWYMSGSGVSDAQFDAWFIYFQSGSVQWGAKGVDKHVRCVVGSK